MPWFRKANAAAAAFIAIYTTWMITIAICPAATAATTAAAAAAAAAFGRGVIDPLKESTVLRIISVGEKVLIRKIFKEINTKMTWLFCSSRRLFLYWPLPSG